MIKEKYYRYMGINGSITSPVLLEDVKSTLIYKLTAESGKKLYNFNTKVSRSFTFAFPDDVEDWEEIDDEID